MNLYQLVYSSTRTPQCTDAEIQNILAACQKNNPGKDITGILLHSDNSFIQYLEGSKDIIKLYDLIKTDPRHTRVVMLSYAPIQQRIFPSWHMGYKNLTRDKIEFLTEGDDNEKKLFNSIVQGEQLTNSNAINLLVKFFNKG